MFGLLTRNGKVKRLWVEIPIREEVPLKYVLPKSRKRYGKEVVSSQD